MYSHFAIPTAQPIIRRTIPATSGKAGYLTGIGCYLYFSSIRGLPAQSVAICGYLEPLSALVFSAVMLHERLTPAQTLGAALILGGAAFGELVRSKRLDALFAGRDEELVAGD